MSLRDAIGPHHIKGLPDEGEWYCSVGDESEFETAEEHIARVVLLALPGAVGEAVHYLRLCKDFGRFHSWAHPEDDEDVASRDEFCDAVVKAFVEGPLETDY